MLKEKHDALFCEKTIHKCICLVTKAVTYRNVSHFVQRKQMALTNIFYHNCVKKELSLK